jgi:hypothetical protein
MASLQLSIADLASHGKTLKRIEEELPLLEARWLELTEQLEGTVAAK